MNQKSSVYANALRILSMDGVQKAKSGHPGAPMGMADMAEVLWREVMSHNPNNPEWINRDRFVLSNGHASMLIYSLLYLTGYDMTLDDLKNFRQFGSKTAGHPEVEVPGIETTTGPLGQGLANAVGMALGEKLLASEFNTGTHKLIDHYTYVFSGDGCMMEGLSHETASLAGTLKLGKLILFYDDNGISIDGKVDGWFTEDIPGRFASYGWQVISGVDGHDRDALLNAIAEAKSDESKPAIICCKTTIGFGSPNKSGKEESHGAPLGDDEIELTRKQLGWENSERFVIPEDVKSAWDCKAKGDAAENEWNALFDSYKAANPEKAAELLRRKEGKLPENWTDFSNKLVKKMQDAGDEVASRKASLMCLNEIGPDLPELLGGSADLAPSNLTLWKGATEITPENGKGNYIHYGVREFAMSAMMNGLSLYGGFIPYGGTFLVFSDYAKNALRMASLMGIPEVFVFTHDSLGVGEDGPTHQPIEQVPVLRLTPGMTVWRPCDTTETAVAWKSSIENKKGPNSLILSRQNLKPMARTEQQLADIARGAYVIKDCEGAPEMIIIATGSEVAASLNVVEGLQADGVKVRLVSMPSCEVFDKQSDEYKESVLPASCENRVAVEAAQKDYWYKYVGLKGLVIGMDGYGLSGPAGIVMDHFGFTTEKISESIKKWMK